MIDVKGVPARYKFLAAPVLAAAVLAASGCGDPQQNVAPKLKGSKDEIQKAMAPPSTKPLRGKTRQGG